MRVVIAGGGQVGKKSLLTKLTGVEGAMTAPYRIDTKYYTADVNVCVAESHEHVRKLDDMEALVLVCDLSNASSVSHLRAYGDVIKATTPGVLLCAANKSDVGVEKLRSECLEWCLDNGVEYVDTDCRPSTPLHQRGEDGEYVGVARVREALCSHMWSGMVLKGQGSDATADGIVGSSGGDATAGAEASHASAYAAASNPQVGTLLGGEGTHSSSTDTHGNTLGAEDFVNPFADGYGPLSGGGAAGDEEESMVADFEKAMEMMSRVRAEGAKVSDGERREMATQALFQIMQLLDLDGDCNDLADVVSDVLGEEQATAPTSDAPEK